MIYALAIFAVLFLALGIIIYVNPGPRVVQNNKSAWLKTLPIAHRGLHTDDAQIPENSLLACQRAMELGYGIEIDVQMSADGKAVVFHDYNLMRMTGLDRELKDLTWEQLQDLKLLKSYEGIPLLRDVLDLVGGQVPLLIEIKNEGAPVAELGEAVINELEGYQGEFAIQAFNPFVLKYFREHAPIFLRGQLSSNFKGDTLAVWKKFLLRYLLLNRVSRPHFVSYETGALPTWFARGLRRKGLYLLTWTVRSMEVYERAVKIFDNVIFEGFRAPLERD